MEVWHVLVVISRLQVGSFMGVIVTRDQGEGTASNWLSSAERDGSSN